MSFRLSVLALATATMACHPSYQPSPPPIGPVADAAITLSEGACFGTCPIYSLTVYPNEFYELDADRFTVNPGMTTGTLPPGSWAAARAALSTASFDTLPADITRGSPACGGPFATDLPSATIAETTIAGTRTVEWYPGCFQAPDRAALNQLVSDLRLAMDVEGLVVP